MTDTSAVLDIGHLTKSYLGFTLDDVSFSVRKGRICGFIGRNGAGKSTTLGCLEGSVHPDSGSIDFFGIPFQGNEPAVKLRVGYELGGVDYYGLRRLDTIVRVVSGFYPAWRAEAFESYRSRFGLDLSKRVNELSQGMRVKFSLALALSRGAEFLILDEPTSGLDPASREEVLTEFQNLVSGGKKTILFSTHLTSDLDKCADDIVYLRNGRVVADMTLKTFRSRYATVPAAAAMTYGLEALGTRTTTEGTFSLVLKNQAKTKLAAAGADVSVLGAPTLDEIMAFDPVR
jgi:ABC-2 type transport system ATP-binding protein